MTVYVKDLKHYYHILFQSNINDGVRDALYSSDVFENNISFKDHRTWGILDFVCRMLQIASGCDTIFEIV